jgi:CRISPR-associated protein Csb1
MSSIKEIVEELLSEDGPSALVLTEELEPAEGRSSVFFPPTYAPPEREEKEESEKPRYAITREGPLSTVVVDSVESQANRLEQLFKKEGYRELVPQVWIKIETTEGKGIQINLLDVSHRIADALVRCSELADDVKRAFNKFRYDGNVMEIAKLSPTSLLFGFWDSRDTGVKAPRLIRSEIRAWKVKEVVRYAQFSPALLKEFRPEKETIVYQQLKPFEELFKEEFKSNETEFDDWLAKEGFASVPVSETKITGGVVLEEDGRIERTTSLHLVGVRAYGGEEEELLRRYLLMLGLAALTAPQDFNLRQGCLLVGKEGGKRVILKIYKDGRKEEVDLRHEEVLEYAREVAREFMTKMGCERKREVKIVYEKLKEMRIAREEKRKRKAER